jgi:hypothetical protein
MKTLKKIYLLTTLILSILALFLIAEKLITENYPIKNLIVIVSFILPVSLTTFICGYCLKNNL